MRRYLLLLLLGGVLFAPQSVAAQTIDVTVEPRTLTCDGQITVRADGLAPNDSFALFFFVPPSASGGAELARATSSADGKAEFAVSQRFPIGVLCDQAVVGFRIAHMAQNGAIESFVPGTLSVPIAPRGGGAPPSPTATVLPAATGNLGFADDRREAAAQRWLAGGIAASVIVLALVLRTRIS